MIRILQIRETPMTKCAGIDANCQGLIDLFSEDADIEMIPTVEYKRHTVPIINQYYLDPKEVYDSIIKYEPDIIQIHGAYSFTLWVVAKCATKFKKPIILSPHLHPFWALKRPKLGKLFFQVITKRVLKLVDCVFTINNEDTEIFSRYHANVVKIPHWSKFEVPTVKPLKNSRMILFVGRLSETNKGFEHLYHLPEGKYEIHCVGQGDVELRSDMIKHTNISDGELNRLYQEAALLVVPSRYEAFSYVALEALTNYTPVLLSDRVRIKDSLPGVDGVNVFTYQDYDDFCNKVEDTIGIEVDAKKINDILSPSRIKQKYKESYIRVITDNRI